ncbi:MAG: GTPase Era [Deltaproteobacteria bacterium]|nr:GTPase Era [Deltaproteobacteria bacterium]
MKSGFVAIIGPPNAGKSTLLNKILGEKLAAVTDKPQTTRSRFLGIYNTDDCQIIFLDTPGVHESEKKLNQFMKQEVEGALGGADVICLLFDATAPDLLFDQFVNRLIKKHPSKNFISLVNKMDLVKEGNLSAKTGYGVPELIAKIIALLPEGPAYYPTDELTDKSLRYLVAEIIREKAMELTFQEIPYSLAVDIISFKEEEKIVSIEANLVVEQESQKGMVIGKGASLIKEIGIRSRKDIIKLIDNKCFLKLNVKVDKNWTKNPTRLNYYGYSQNSK